MDYGLLFWFKRSPWVVWDNWTGKFRGLLKADSVRLAARIVGGASYKDYRGEVLTYKWPWMIPASKLFNGDSIQQVDVWQCECVRFFSLKFTTLKYRDSRIESGRACQPGDSRFAEGQMTQIAIFNFDFFLNFKFKFDLEVLKNV